MKSYLRWRNGLDKLVQCRAIKLDGDQCTALVRKGRTLCPSHRRYGANQGLAEQKWADTLEDAADAEEERRGLPHDK